MDFQIYNSIPSPRLFGPPLDSLDFINIFQPLSGTDG